ncbi:MAG: nucleoside-diphosphate kinase [Armatimonadetes bacterium]|nr:nucleoside-diphosphate kinase [Armatimonadota bacterium]
MERTYIMVKPDGVQRKLTGEIIRRFENRGLTLVALKMLTPKRETAEKHYAVHAERPFYGELVDFVTSGPVVAMVWEGKDIVKITRAMIGATKPTEALPGTIRGDFTADMMSNLIHGSDAPEAAEDEIALWFGEGEL